MHALVSHPCPKTTRSAGDSPQRSCEARTRHVHSIAKCPRGPQPVGVGETGGRLGGIEMAPGTGTGYCSMVSRSGMQVGSGAGLSGRFRYDTVGVKPHHLGRRGFAILAARIIGRPRSRKPSARYLFRGSHPSELIETPTTRQPLARARQSARQASVDPAAGV